MSDDSDEVPTPPGTPGRRWPRHREREVVEPKPWVDDDDPDTETVGPMPEPGAGRSGRSMVEAGPLAEPSQAFHFLLQGGVDGSTLVIDRPAVLVFDFGSPPADALAVLDSQELDEARGADVAIRLHATPRGGLVMLSEPTQEAVFRDGHLRAPVRFRCVATQMSSAAAAIHVDFSVRGTHVYGIELPLRVAAAPVHDGAPTAPASGALHTQLAFDVLQAARRVPAPPDQCVELLLHVDDRQFTIELVDWRGGRKNTSQRFVAHDIGRARLKQLLDEVQGELANCYLDTVWERFDGSAPLPSAAAALQRSMAMAANAGWRLHAELSRSPGIKAALAYIETQVADGAVLSVTTDDVFVPWELMYPRPHTANMSEAQARLNPLDPRLFWGVRFAVETVQRGEGSLIELNDRQRETAPAVSLNVDPAIGAPGAERHPLQVQQAWARRMQLAEPRTQCAAVRRVLQDDEDHPTLIYVYCHGTSGGNDELRLCEGCALRPLDVEAGSRYVNAPVVFLNSCRSGAYSPMSFSTFLSLFRQRGALGMIATTGLIPVVFGAHFGAEVVQAYLARQGRLAGALLDLRRKHVLERGNPVPLLYSVQCQLDFAAEAA